MPMQYGALSIILGWDFLGLHYLQKKAIREVSVVLDTHVYNTNELFCDLKSNANNVMI